MCKILNDSQWLCLSQPVSEHIVCCSTAVIYIAGTQTEGHDKQSLLHLFGVICGCDSFPVLLYTLYSQTGKVTTASSCVSYNLLFVMLVLWVFYKCQTLIFPEVTLLTDRMLKSIFWRAYCCVSVVYIFDAQTGKAMGDGKPVTHKVSALCSVLELLSFLTFS